LIKSGGKRLFAVRVRGFDQCGHEEKGCYDEESPQTWNFSKYMVCPNGQGERGS